jgi:hypothetical protein
MTHLMGFDHVASIPLEELIGARASKQGELGQ